MDDKKMEELAAEIAAMPDERRHSIYLLASLERIALERGLGSVTVEQMDDILYRYLSPVDDFVRDHNLFLGDGTGCGDLLYELADQARAVLPLEEFLGMGLTARDIAKTLAVAVDRGEMKRAQVVRRALGDYYEGLRNKRVEARSPKNKNSNDGKH